MVLWKHAFRNVGKFIKNQKLKFIIYVTTIVFHHRNGEMQSLEAMTVHSWCFHLDESSADGKSKEAGLFTVGKAYNIPYP